MNKQFETMKRPYIMPGIEVSDAYSLRSDICGASQDGWAEVKERKDDRFHNDFEDVDELTTNDNAWGKLW